MTYLRYVLKEAIGGNEQPKPATPTQKADTENTQPLPVPQENASDVIQNTGPEGEGSYDSASGGGFVSTEEQLYNAKVGDKIVKGSAIDRELQALARGE